MSNKFDALKTSDDSGEDEAPTKLSHKDDKESLPTIVIPPDDHKLQYNYWLWFSRRSPGKTASVQNYDQNLKLIGHFGSVEQFWSLYSHLARPCDLQSHSDFHLFKDGIKPMWEDEANSLGGKWIVRLRKGLASRCWENLVLAMLGEQFMVGEEICGAVVSIRFQEDIISVWNKTASDLSTNNRIRDTLRRVLNLPPNTILEYKSHNDSLKSLDILIIKAPTTAQFSTFMGCFNSLHGLGNIIVHLVLVLLGTKLFPSIFILNLFTRITLHYTCHHKFYNKQKNTNFA